MSKALPRKGSSAYHSGQMIAQLNPSTNIRYALPVASQVSLTILDVLGRVVSAPVDGKEEAGIHEFKFDASGLSSGVYFYRLRAGDFVQTRKLLLLH